jgi:hypothetical protein
VSSWKSVVTLLHRCRFAEIIRVVHVVKQSVTERDKEFER